MFTNLHATEAEGTVPHDCDCELFFVNCFGSDAEREADAHCAETAGI